LLVHFLESRHCFRGDDSGLLISMCRQPKSAPQRNHITRKLAISKFANWILCFCLIRVLAMGNSV
jgi:hypothetical protein